MQMEDWSFPPRYDNSYRPDASSRYWFPVRETMPAADRDAAIVKRLKQVCTYAYAHAPFYKKKWDAAGFHPDQLNSLEDFEDKVPVITKRDLRASQAEAEPFGDYLCIAREDVYHIHGTSGTTGRPTAFAIGRNDWDAISNAQARVMWGMGIRPGDTVFLAAIFSLYLGSWGALAGTERLGATSFPFGAGATDSPISGEDYLVQRDDTLWKSDVVEVYLDPGGDTKDYVELQFNPKNAIFDAIFKSAIND